MAKIFFDLDGVLIQSRFHDKTFLWSKNIERDLGLDPAIKTELFKQPEWNEIISGKGNFKDKLSTVFRENRISLNVDAFIDYWLSNDLNWNQDVLRFASDIQKAGHDIYIATNQDEIRGYHIRNQPNVKNTFNEVFTSFDLKTCKPNPEFFNQIRNRHFGNSIDDFFLIDDLPKNIEAARTNRWTGLYFNPDLEPDHTADWLRAELSHLL